MMIALHKQARTKELPWADLIMQRGSTTLDARYEHQLH